MKSLKDYLRELGSDAKRNDFAERCGSTYKYLRLVGYGNKRASPELAINIERETGGVIKAEDLRPDVDWAFIRGAKARKPSKAPTSLAA